MSTPEKRAEASLSAIMAVLVPGKSQVEAPAAVLAQVIATIMIAQAIGRIATVIEDMAAEAKKEQASAGRG